MSEQRMARTGGVRGIKEVTNNLITRTWKVVRERENARRRSERTKPIQLQKTNQMLLQAIVWEAAQRGQSMCLHPSIMVLF